MLHTLYILYETINIQFLKCRNRRDKSQKRRFNYSLSLEVNCMGWIGFIPQDQGVFTFANPERLAQQQLELSWGYTNNCQEVLIHDCGPSLLTAWLRIRFTSKRRIGQKNSVFFPHHTVSNLLGLVFFMQEYHTHISFPYKLPAAKDLPLKVSHVIP